MHAAGIPSQDPDFQNSSQIYNICSYQLSYYNTYLALSLHFSFFCFAMLKISSITVLYMLAVTLSVHFVCITSIFVCLYCMYVC